MSESLISKISKAKRNSKLFSIALPTAAILIAIGAYVFGEHNKAEIQPKKDVSTYYKDLEQGNIKGISVTPNYLYQQYEIELKDGAKYKFEGPHTNLEESQKLAERGVKIEWADAPSEHARHIPQYALLTLFSVFLLMTLGQQFGITFMKAATRSQVKMKDVAGNEEAKAAMQEIVEYLRNPEDYEKIGAKFPKGAIMAGPPGTGKTLLAKAVAGEANANFMAVSGSDFSSMFVAMTAMKIRGIFASAKRNAPCVIFIDEIDAIGGMRLSEGTAVAREMGSALNTLLVKMDGFDDNAGVIVIAATNRIDMLDPALLRSGRFDRHIHMQLPNLSERTEILKIHAEKINTQDGLDYEAVAKECAGMSGADMQNVINQAALIALREQSEVVTTTHALKGRDRVLMGDARHSQASSMTPKTKRILAVHESGHAIVGMVYGPDAVSRISILPRGQSLGQTMFIPAEDAYVVDAENLLCRIRVLLGGRAAEIFALDIQTTGAADDLQRATKFAMDYVTKYGMGSRSLLMVNEQSSEFTKLEAEKEASAVLERCMSDAYNVLLINRMVFEDMVSTLQRQEEIHGELVKKFALQVRNFTQVPREVHDVKPVQDEEKNRNLGNDGDPVETNQTTA